MKSKKEKPYVMQSTINKTVRGGFPYPGDKRLLRIGRHKVFMERSERLDKYGNPVHTATYIKPDGSVGKSYRSNGSGNFIVAETLKRNGIDVKYSRPRYK